MTRCLLPALLVSAAVSAATAAAQTTTPPPKDQAVTMSGCVASATGPQSAMTFADGDTGNKYRLSGKSLKRFAGQRVEIVGGSPTSKLSVRGGLYPSPNVAAQAGARDPAKAAIAAQPGGTESGTGPVDSLPEFRVTRVRAIPGACQ